MNQKAEATGLAAGGNVSITVSNGNFELNMSAIKNNDLDPLSVQRNRENEGEGTTTNTTSSPGPSSSSSSLRQVSKNGRRVLDLLTQKCVQIPKFLQRHHSDLCNNTTHKNEFLGALFELEILSVHLVEEYGGASTEAACMQKIYKVIGQKQAMPELIKALEDSDNGHMVLKLMGWLEEL